MSRGALPGRKPGRAASRWKSLVTVSKAASTAEVSTSKRTSFLQGAKSSIVTFTGKTFSLLSTSVAYPNRMGNRNRQCELTNVGKQRRGVKFGPPLNDRVELRKVA